MACGVNPEVHRIHRPLCQKHRQRGSAAHIHVTKAHLPVLLLCVCLCRGHFAPCQSLSRCCFPHCSLTMQQKEQWSDTPFLLAVRMKGEIYDYRHIAQGRCSSIILICVAPFLPFCFRLHSQYLPLYLSITTELVAHSQISFI